MSVAFGDFDGASSISLTGAYRMSPNLAVELLGETIAGDSSDGWLLAHVSCTRRFPSGASRRSSRSARACCRSSPRASLVSTEDRTDQYGQVGVGVRAYLTRRFMFRTEYTGYVSFTSRDENEKVEEWKAGFAFFF